MYFYYVAFHDTCIIHREHKIVNSKIFAAHKINKLAFAASTWYNIFFRSAMSSGIYQLTFSSGKFYIGKSENIKQRWEQHRASFTKGTHSKKMQEEYELCGPPEYKIILDVHTDHIGVFESIVIINYWGPNCLNTVKPQPVMLPDAVKLTEYYNTMELNNTPVMSCSLATILDSLQQYYKLTEKQAQQLLEAAEDIEELELRGIKMPDTWQLINKKLKDKNNQLVKTNDIKTQELQRVQQLSWWDRLWNYKVNV